MGRRGRRRGKRNRERRSRDRPVCRAEWWFSGRKAVVVEVTRRGDVWVTVRLPKWRVSPGDRERAAAWLGEFLPRLTHDERWHVLWS